MPTSCSPPPLSSSTKTCRPHTATTTSRSPIRRWIRSASAAPMSRCEGSFVEDAYLYTGSIDIIRTNEPRGNVEGKYSVIYVPGSGGGAARDVAVQGLGRLRDYLL